MKQVSSILISFLFFSHHIVAQSFIASYPLTVSCNKTTHLIFPLSIKSVDRGTGLLLAQKAKGVENVLQVKARKPHFSETNLTVITSDGKIYSFVVNYEDLPSRITIDFSRDSTADHPGVIFVKEGFNEGELQGLSAKIMRARNRMHLKSYHCGMALRLQGLYISGETIFCKIRLQNYSEIPYDIEAIRFYIHDRRKARLTATQEIEIKPLYTMGNIIKVAARAKETVVLALPKFTLQDGKDFILELTESGGGRQLTLKVPNHKLLHARPIEMQSSNNQRVSF